MRFGRIGSEEFETILELIVEVLFMAVGIVFITLSMHNLSYRTRVLQRDDKMQVSDREILADYDFKYTGYQTYMFFKLLDGLCQEDLTVVNNDPTWYSNRNFLNTDARNNYDPNCCVAAIEPSIQKLSFMTYKNMRLSGAADGKHRSVAEVIYHTGVELDEQPEPVPGTLPEDIDYTPKEARDAVVAIYRHEMYHGKMAPYFKLELTATHCGDDNDIKSNDGLNIYEQRRIRKWTLHTCYNYTE